jgi:excisionase family DNA binding protein
MRDQSSEPLLLTVRQAAALLSISERTLWGLTKSSQLPVVRIGRAVRYDFRDLTDWVEARKARVCAPGRSAD